MPALRKWIFNFPAQIREKRLCARLCVRLCAAVVLCAAIVLRAAIVVRAVTCPQSSFERPPSLHMPRPDTSLLFTCPYSNTRSIYAIQVPNMQHKLYCINAVEEACVLLHPV